MQLDYLRVTIKVTRSKLTILTSIVIVLINDAHCYKDVVEVQTEFQTATSTIHRRKTEAEAVFMVVEKAARPVHARLARSGGR
jgi:hypothetical protein